MFEMRPIAGLRSRTRGRVTKKQLLVPLVATAGVLYWYAAYRIYRKTKEAVAAQGGIGGVIETVTAYRPGGAEPFDTASNYVAANIQQSKPTALAWLRLWAATVASRTGRRPMITSGLRSPMAQAEAMLDKVRRGENLHALYRNDQLIDDLLKLPRTATAWAAVLAVRPVSSHQSGKAFDVRTRDRSSSEVAAMKSIAAELRGSGLIESDHLHIEAGSSVPIS